MKTIGVDIRVLGTGRLSGIEEYTEQLLAHMIPIAPQVAWKLFYSGHAPLEHRPWMDYPHVTVVDTGMSNRLLWFSTRVRRRPLLDELVGGADVFFFPHFLLGALSPTCRRVMTWHDLSYEKMPYLLSVYRRMWHNVQMRPRMQARSADRIIAVSSATANDLFHTYGIERNRVSVVPSGVNPSLRRVSESEIRQWRLRRGIDAPFILAMGTREPRKNIPALICAWDRVRHQPALRTIHLVIAGQGGWMEQEILAARASTRAPQDIHFIENITHEERSAMMSAASMLVYPSLMEGFGFPPLEAMACGTPTIASATSSIIQTVGQAGLLVDPYRVDGIAAAISELYSDQGLRSRLIAKGYERAREYSWERAARATLSELLSVL